MRVVMVGSGYVGLVSGACFSEFGTDVVCVDKDVAKIQDLNEGRIPIFEPGLNRLDDMRDAPSLVIVPALQAAGATLRGYDPAGMTEAGRLLSDVAWCTDAYSAVQDADALVIMTEWNEFRALDLARVREALNTPIVVDMRNIYDPAEMRELGFRYSCVGRAVDGSGPAR